MLSCSVHDLSGSLTTHVTWPWCDMHVLSFSGEDSRNQLLEGSGGQGVESGGFALPVSHLESSHRLSKLSFLARKMGGINPSFLKG